MKLFKGKEAEYPPEEEGKTWIAMETVESGRLGSLSVRDEREAQQEEVRTTFVRDPSPAALHVWYRPACSAGWVIPAMYFGVIIATMAIADIIFDNYYTDMIVAISVSGAFCLLVAFYYIGRYLDTRYSAQSPTCNMIWRYIFFPVGCMRANATNLMDSASTPPEDWKQADGEKRGPLKKSFRLE